MSTNFLMRFKHQIIILFFSIFLFSPSVVRAEKQEKGVVDQLEEIFHLDDEEEQEVKVKDAKKVQIDTSFFVRLGVNVMFMILIILTIYYPNYKKMDTIFTFITFNITIFMLTFVLNTVKISMGAAFGLFAVFSMLRYRTSGIHIKDMTYLFIFIALGLISSIPMDIYELMVIGGVIFVATLILDTKLILKKESVKSIRWEDINYIQPENEKILIEQIKERTGLNVHRISIEQIDYLKDVCVINIYYYN